MGGCMSTYILVVMLGIGITGDGGANMYHIPSLSKETCESMKQWVITSHKNANYGSKPSAECFKEQ